MGADPDQLVRPCVRAPVRHARVGHEIGKREIPINAIEQEKADLGHFREFRVHLKDLSKTLHKRNCLLVVFRGAEKVAENV